MKKLTYKELRERHQEETNKLPIYWAFGSEQYEELKKKLNIKNDDELKEKCFGIFGGIALKTDKEKILETLKRHNEEEKKLFEDDDFLQSAFEYELGNHEYIITYDLSDTLRALGISYKEYQESERYQNIMEVAISNYREEMKKFGW